MLLKKLFKLTGLLLLCSSMILAWFWMDYQAFLKTGLSVQQSLLLNINQGSGLNEVTRQLSRHKIIQKPLYFKLMVILAGKEKHIKAGEYQIQPGNTPLQIMDMLVQGRVVQNQLTIPEGWTFKQILELLENSRLNTENLDKIAAKEIDLSVSFANKQYPVEGFIYPDTYYYPTNMSDINFIKRSIERMKNILAREWENRDKNLPIKTAYEALILASIVEKESGMKSERQKIAGVFMLRLRKKMPLQSDPTIIYGMGSRYKGNIRKKDINEKTAYNTYQIQGLPPTPIASPGQDAIHAVLHPHEDGSLYFVADGSGGHYFSKTLKQHNKAVRKYILNQ